MVIWNLKGGGFFVVHQELLDWSLNIDTHQLHSPPNTHTHTAVLHQGFLGAL